MAKRKRRKSKPGVIRRAIGRWAWAKVNTWAQNTKARTRKTFAPRVIVPSAKHDHWRRQFPDPNRRRPLTETMERQDEWMAGFEVLFHNGWRVEFEVDSIDRKADLRAEAYEAAVRRHGEIARSLTLVEIVPLDDLADAMIQRGR